MNVFVLPVKYTEEFHDVPTENPKAVPLTWPLPVLILIFGVSSFTADHFQPCNITFNQEASIPWQEGIFQIPCFTSCNNSVTNRF